MAVTNNNHIDLTNLELSIQISLSGHSFCVLDTNTKTIIELKAEKFSIKKTPSELLDAIKHLFNTETILKQVFKSINIIHVNDWSTIVPKPLFEESALADYLKFNTKILKTDFITFDEISANDSINVYVPFTNINNFIFDRFGSFTYNHFSTILIEQLLTFEKHSSTSKVYINTADATFEIIVLNKGKLLLYNTFEFHTKEDFIYYLLFTLEQLQLNPETIDVLFLGDIDEDNPLFKIAYKYIRNVSFGNRIDTYAFAEKPLHNHSYFTLLKSL
ncbi:DUF3822 family protein [Olleya sp. Bg11-27]|uniref:DUF3822 family protein n=1 Tax=Olleya sp. Bg11-27 TaxID=2058135 RepID=UPI000C318242|nr:DUF3822 family protein [Olleya sp. Bg11-27]AUC76255.1 DUF3822 domain-containing protein [Olleya sp. Bg11-27]